MQTPRRPSTLSASELADLDKHDALVIESVSKHFMKSGGRSRIWRGKQKSGPRLGRAGHDGSLTVRRRESGGVLGSNRPREATLVRRLSPPLLADGGTAVV